MPYEARQSEQCPESKPWACVKTTDGEIMGCHATEDDAMAQQRALMASEDSAMRTSWSAEHAYTLAKMGDRGHLRTVPVELELADGRLFGRLVPYDTPAQVADELPGGGFDVYNEGFRKGAFARQAESNEPGVLRRIGLKYEHDDPLRQGVLMSLEEHQDGLYGEYMILPSYRDNWQALYNEAGIRDLSIEYFARKGGTSVEDDVRWRTSAHLASTALVAKGAYGSVGAGVLAMRDIDELVAEQEAEREAERQRAETEAAEREAAERAEAEAERRRCELAELVQFADEARARQAELEARFGLVG